MFTVMLMMVVNTTKEIQQVNITPAEVVVITFEPKNPGKCTGDKCAAGGSY